MNIKKIEKQLKKINQLFDTIKEDGHMSAIERDLMLSYIRGLYEKIALPQDKSTQEPEPPRKKEKKEVIEPEKVEVPVAASSHIADVVMQEVVEAGHQIEPTPIQTQPTIPIEAPVQAPIHTEVVVEEVVETVIEDLKPQAPQELLALFESGSINELSDKLSRSPITDLTKCMGINEKIFTVQELFGGDKSLFDRSMETLDKMTSLEQARDYLVENVALDQNWHLEKNIKKASHFIKLISRRY